MALYNELPIYKHGCDLLALAVDVQTQMPRMFKRSLGEKIHTMCVDMLEAMACANAVRGQDRVQQLDTLLQHLRLNPRKTILQPVERGIDFVGHLIKPWRRITRRKTLRMATERLWDMPAADLHQSANSYFGLLRQATHSHHDRAQLAKLMLRRGHAVKGNFTKTYRSKPCPPSP